jgi:hypothetical protein
MERLPPCTGFGKTMVEYMKEIRWPETEIDFDMADYEEEND